jgi:hypothetical protein
MTELDLTKKELFVFGFLAVWVSILILVLVIYPVGDWSFLAKVLLVGVTIATIAVSVVLLLRKRARDTEKMLSVRLLNHL